MNICTGALTDKIKTCKLTISTLRIYSYLHLVLMSNGLNCFTTMITLRHVMNIVAKVYNFKTTFIIFRNCYFRIVIKNVTKCNIFKIFALKNNGKFANQNFKKLCSRSSATTISVLDVEKAVLKKSVFRVLGLKSCVLNSTSGLNYNCTAHKITIKYLLCSYFVT